MTATARCLRALELSSYWMVCVAALVGWTCLASRHPLQPGLALALGAVWLALAALRPGVWLFVLPAALPVASLAPWTGWLTFDEFDILVAAGVAGSYGRMAVKLPRSPKQPSRAAVAAASVFCSLALLGLARGAWDAGGVKPSMFQGYADVMNSIRVFKPALYALLIWPLLRQSFLDDASSVCALRRLVRGMLLGLCLVLLAVLRERVAYPGLWDFSSRYRTVGLFWEMHVGGAAIDAYLALAVPFAAWSLWSARSKGHWGVAAVLVLLAEYACLTTFSRGVYVAVGGQLIVLGALLLRRKVAGAQDRSGFHSHPAAAITLVLVLALQAIVVLNSESFMLSRIGSSERDLRSRIAHWQQGLNLLKTPTDWLFGTGLGRLPSRYDATARGGEFPGTVTLGSDGFNPVVRLAGPRSLPALGGLYGLTQQVSINARPPLRVSFDARAERPTRVRLSVCEVHLLYERHCLAAVVRLEPGGPGLWHTASVRLDGPKLSAGVAYAQRSAVFAVTVLDANATVELDNLSITSADGSEQVSNGGFAQELSRWFPVAQNQFLPWHIDNLYLDLLIERGASGLAAFLLLVGAAVWRLGFGAARHCAISPFLLASLTGAMTVGVVSSIMDVPRVAFGLLLVVLVSLSLKPESKRD